jgi:hypothetical protein
MFVPLHDGHQIKQHGESTERETQCDIAFAARAHRIVIPHVSANAGSPINFSAIKAANNAVI